MCGTCAFAKLMIFTLVTNGSIVIVHLQTKWGLIRVFMSISNTITSITATASWMLLLFIERVELKSHPSCILHVFHQWNRLLESLCSFIVITTTSAYALTLLAKCIISIMLLGSISLASINERVLENHDNVCYCLKNSLTR